MYNLHKSLWDRDNFNNNLQLYTIYLFLIFPVKFFIRFITTFSYISLKIVLDLALFLHELSFYNYEKHSIHIDNILYNININCFYNRWEMIYNMNISIYCCNFINFNS